MVRESFIPFRPADGFSILALHTYQAVRCCRQGSMCSAWPIREFVEGSKRVVMHLVVHVGDMFAVGRRKGVRSSERASGASRPSSHCSYSGRYYERDRKKGRTVDDFEADYTVELGEKLVWNEATAIFRFPRLGSFGTLMLLTSRKLCFLFAN